MTTSNTYTITARYAVREGDIVSYSDSLGDTLKGVARGWFDTKHHTFNLLVNGSDSWYSTFISAQREIPATVTLITTAEAVEHGDLVNYTAANGSKHEAYVYDTKGQLVDSWGGDAWRKGFDFARRPQFKGGEQVTLKRGKPWRVVVAHATGSLVLSRPVKLPAGHYGAGERTLTVAAHDAHLWHAVS